MVLWPRVRTLTCTCTCTRTRTCWVMVSFPATTPGVGDPAKEPPYSNPKEGPDGPYSGGFPGIRWAQSAGYVGALLSGWVVSWVGDPIGVVGCSNGWVLRWGECLVFRLVCVFDATRAQAAMCHASNVVGHNGVGSKHVQRCCVCADVRCVCHQPQGTATTPT